MALEKSKEKHQDDSNNFLRFWCFTMMCSRIPQLVRLIAGRYQDIFRDAGISYSMLCTLIVMILFGTPVLSLFVLYTPFSPSVSTLSRWLKKFDEDVINRAQRRLIFSVLKQVMRDPEHWIWVIDSTENIKRTEGLAGRGAWANSSHEMFFGQNMMMLCAVNIKTGVAIPVHWKPWLKAKERAVGQTNHHLVLKLIDDLLEQGWPKLTLVMDSWFDSAELMEELNSRKITFLIQLKSSRKPRTNSNPRSGKKNLCEIFQNLARKSFRCTTREIKTPSSIGWENLRFICGEKIWINGSGKASKQIHLNVAAVYNHPKEKNAFGYYATNDLSKPYTWCWKMSRHRWNVEVCFRDLRQGFQWGKLAAKLPQSAHFSWTMPIIILAFMREQDQKTPILTALRQIKNEEYMATIDFHAEKPNNIYRKNLRIRLLGTPAGNKVRITSAERNKSHEKSNSPLKNAA